MDFAFDGTQTTAEWQRWHGRNVEVEEGSVSLEKERTPTYVSPRLLVSDPPSSFTPVDIDVDECGDLYVLTEEGELHRYDHRAETLRKLPCLWYPEDDAGGADEGPRTDPVGLCVTEDSIYVADGVLGGVAAFSKQGHQMRWIARTAGDEPLATPVACIGDAREGYVLVRGPGEGGGFVARMDVSGVAETPVVGGLRVPEDLALGSDGDLYVLDRQVRSEEDGGDGTGEPVPVVRRFSETDSDDREFEELDGDEVWIPPEYEPRCIEAVTGRQVLIGVGIDPTKPGREITPYRYLPALESTGADPFERIASFKRTCSTLRLRRRGTSSLGKGFYAITGPGSGAGAGDEGEIYFLEGVRRNRLDARTDGYDGRMWRRFDSGVSGTEWHRVVTDLHLEGIGTQVRLGYYATDAGDVGDLEADLGVGREHAVRLRDAGIVGAWGVLEQRPETLAELVAVPPDVIDGWIDDAWQFIGETVDRRVRAVRGIGRKYGRRLGDAGVSGVADLIELDAVEIVEIAEPRNGLGAANRWLRDAWDIVDEDVDEDWPESVGIDPAFVPQLGAAGVERISTLAKGSPEELAGRFRISTDDTADWIAAARAHVEAEWDQHGEPSTLSNPRDALLEAAEGRYLWVELELVGNDSSSPRVDSFRAYFPRQSYLRYLPAIYREDERSAAFLERFLSIFESTFVGIEEDIGSVTRYLDAEGVSEEYIAWLGSWVGIETDGAWSEPLRRTVVGRAPDMFKKRGTPEGLMEMLVAYLGTSATLPPDWEAALERDRERTTAQGEHGEPTRDGSTAETAPRRRSVYLIEYADLDCIDVEDAREVYVAQLGCPQCFLVLVPPFVEDEAIGAVERIVESATPAHAVGRAVGLQPRIQLGGASYPGNTYLGVNSALSDQQFVLEGSVLGTDSMLKGRDEFGRLELRSRLDTDTVIS